MGAAKRLYAWTRMRKRRRRKRGETRPDAERRSPDFAAFESRRRERSGAGATSWDDP